MIPDFEGLLGNPISSQQHVCCFALLTLLKHSCPVVPDVPWAILILGVHEGGRGGVLVMLSPPCPCAVGRKQFLRFESASRAAEVLGCDVEELGTAVFKHHLRHILAQVTARGQPQAEESTPGTGVSCPFSLYFSEGGDGEANCPVFLGS